MERASTGPPVLTSNLLEDSRIRTPYPIRDFISVQREIKTTSYTRSRTGTCIEFESLL